MKFIAKFFLSLSEEMNEYQRRSFLVELLSDEDINSLSVDNISEILVACTHRFAGPAIEGELFSYDFSTQRLRDLIEKFRNTKGSFLPYVKDCISQKAYSPSPMLLAIVSRGLDSIIEIADAALEESVISSEEREFVMSRQMESTPTQQAEIFSSTFRRLIASYAARLHDFGVPKHCISSSSPSSKRTGFTVYFQHLLQDTLPTRPDETSLLFAVLHKELETHLLLGGRFTGTWGRLELANKEIWIMAPEKTGNMLQESWELANIIE